MTELDALLLFSGLTVLYLMFLGRLQVAGWHAVVLYGIQMLGIWKLSGLAYGGPVVPGSLSLEVLGQVLSWRFDALSWFFAMITVGAAFLSSWFAAGDWLRKYREEGGSPALFHVALSLNVFAMLLLLASGDLITLFIGWELVSWASYLLMVLAGGAASQAAMRYITYAMGGAMAILAGLGLVYSLTGSLSYQGLMDAVPSMGSAQLAGLVILFGLGFGIKMAVMPFHLWQATAYARTPGPGAAFLGAISSRMGLYAIVVVLVQLIGLSNIEALEIPYTFMDGTDLIAWIAAFTIILPTFTALKQNDARMLLFWHGIGQGGYMLLGLMTFNQLGTAGGLMHVFNYATYQAALVLVVFAVIHRTGTADLNRLGGLVTRMPLSFMVMLVGIIGLAGIPPMSGFVSKWLVYRSLMIEGMPLLFVASVIGTLGTILSVYKLIHNMFLGQLRAEHARVSEAPLSMMLPMLILAIIVFVTGVAPGLVLQWVASAQSAVGLEPLVYTLGGVETDSGSLDMLWVVGVLFAGFGIGWLVFLSGGKSKRIHPLDNYAGGHFLTSENRYQYSDNFYAGLMNLIGPWYRQSFQFMESAVMSSVSFISMGMQGLYRTVHPAFYLLVVVVITMSWVML
jgi:formate hydrogenlyase subunit 3/multisubunit Na+/H+ antiporter MnhD subunit